ncbi:uncharacterized protein LOC133893252 [Phragmites australis]|uniref:uncharacterized protein LOC133893252 n=1 Tax=Phragmites australis TaxID=29695 RepID=UPI002D77FCE4|nr:uncharacterized protein LOC133893252 [Phragmites australis]XP_062190215.1 uncharacterized protein LOC133893252 [Phragmites australis]XP_062190217.1 uncharacterized protein LOC133893252 [Phragmites australis]
MMEEVPADLRDLVRLPDVLVVCSSSGWTDERHMLYLRLLEETFISQLQDSECSFKGLFNHSARFRRRMKASKQIIKYAEPDQGCLGIVESDRAKPCLKVEHIDSPSCCGNQQDGKVYSLDDNTSTTGPVEEATSHARETSSRQSSTCYFGKHRHSPSRSAEGSDQNFNEETKGIGESRRGCSQKRLKSADDMRDDQVVPSVKAEVQQAGCLNASDKDGDNCEGWSKVHAGLLDAEAGSPSCKDHGPKG